MFTEAEDQIKVKRIGSHDLPAPEKATTGAAAYDLRITQDVTLFPGHERMVHTGFAWEIPRGYVGLIMPRSGLGTRDGIVLSNLTGVIDSDYRGEVLVKLWNRKGEGTPCKLSAGHKIAQMVVIKLSVVHEVLEVETLSETIRGDGGFGSTGR